MTISAGIEEGDRPVFWNGQIVVVGEDPAIRAKIIDLVSSAGGRIVKPLKTTLNTRDIETRLNAIAVIIQFSSWNETSLKSLSIVQKFCSKHDLPMLIVLPLGLLDRAIAEIEYSNTEYLIDDGGTTFFAELLVSLDLKVHATRSATFSNRDEPTLVELKKISQDVKRIARILSQLSGAKNNGFDRDHIRNPSLEPKPPSTVSDDPLAFKNRTVAELPPLGTNTDNLQNNSMIDANHIRRAIKARRMRNTYFDAQLFADPAWDMLLDLMAARLENAKVSVSSLCIASSVPPTTALRWIKVMTEEKIFERRADEKDGRRIFIQLSDNAAKAMTDFFSKVQQEKLIAV